MSTDSIPNPPDNATASTENSSAFDGNAARKIEPELFSWDELKIHPDHRADLEKSGIQPDVMASRIFESLTTRATVDAWLKANKLYTQRLAKQITSLLIIKYGNDYARAKVFPSGIEDGKGGTRRYLQPAGVGNRLFIPFLPSALEDIQSVFRITEGEKKGLKFTQTGKHCAAISGLHNYQTKKKRLIADLRNINMSGRPVEHIPDGDVWRAPDSTPDNPRGQVKLLTAVYRLAKILTDLGASVDIVQLPSTPGQDKLDDFLVYHGDKREEEYAKLPRISLDADCFKLIAQREARQHPDPKTFTPESGAAELDAIVQAAKEDPIPVYEQLLDAADLLSLTFEKERAYVEKQFVTLISAGVKKGDLDRLRTLFGSLTKERKNRSKHEDASDEATGLCVRDIPFLINAPVSKEALVPKGWSYTVHGIVDGWGPSDENSPVKLPTIALPTARLKDVSAGTESIRFAFLQDGGWATQTVDRGVLANSRKIVELASQGFPVTSNSASDVVQYFGDYLRTNAACIPVASVSPKMGWIDQTQPHSFLWGKQPILHGQTEATLIDIESLPPEQWPQNVVTYHASDPGGQQLARGMRASGTYAAWAESTALAARYPHAILSFYTALTPPFMELFQSPNFCVDYAGLTARGKTTCLQIGAAAWGCPDPENPGGSLVHTWDNTPVWIEQTAERLSSLPMFIDDTRLAKKPADVARVIYSLCSGQGRGRGQLQGNRRTGTWRTIGILSGEQPATSFVEGLGGQHTRVLSLHGKPFGPDATGKGELVYKIKTGLQANYGHAGPRLVQWLVNHPEQHDVLRKNYKTTLAMYQEKAGTNPEAQRLATYFAPITVAAALAHEVLALPWEYQDPVTPLWEELVDRAQAANQGERALSYVYGWAAGNHTRFWGRHTFTKDGDIKEPPNGWLGIWPLEEAKTEPKLALLPLPLELMLKQANFQPTEMYEQWREKGWLAKANGQKGYQMKCGLNGARPNCIILNAAALAHLKGKEEDEVSRLVGG